MELALETRFPRLECWEWGAGPERTRKELRQSLGRPLRLDEALQGGCCPKALILLDLTSKSSLCERSATRVPHRFPESVIACGRRQEVANALVSISQKVRKELVRSEGKVRLVNHCELRSSVRQPIVRRRRSSSYSSP